MSAVSLHLSSCFTIDGFMLADADQHDWMRHAPRVTESRVSLLDSFVTLQWSGDMRSRHEMTALDAPSQRVGRPCLRCLIGKPDCEALGSGAMSYGPDRGQIARAKDRLRDESPM